MRRLLRSTVPAPVRLIVAVLRRGLNDLATGIRFATKREWDSPAHPFGEYALPMLTYPGQEQAREAKHTNSQLLAAALRGSVVEPGETWSLWQLAGAPTRAKGYSEASAIVNGELTNAVGGATCLVSTVVYNAGLLAGLEVVERTQHSIDTYGEQRYFELGRDATIEYGYLDLRFRNDFPWPLRLEVDVRRDAVQATFVGPLPRPFNVDIAVAVDRSVPGAIKARTRRTTRGPMLPTRTWTTTSRYRVSGLDDSTAISDPPLGAF